MYKGLEHNATKKYYRFILDETIGQIESDPLSQTPFFQYILGQLYDIKENVVEKGIYSGWDEVNEHYTLGGFAVKNFEEGEEMRDRLCDIFGGACYYSEFPEE